MARLSPPLACVRTLAQALLLAAVAVFAAPAQASLPGLDELVTTSPELATSLQTELPRELPGPCEGEQCGELAAPQPKTRVRGFELDLYCRLGGEQGLSCRPRQVWLEEYGEGTSDRLVYAKARYFDPELGRFLSQDSYLGELTEPPSLHRYLYAWDRPTYFIDANGHEVSLAEAAEQEKARRAALQKETSGQHGYTSQGQGCGTRCEQDAYYKEQARLHPSRPEAPQQAKAERVGEERSLLQRVLDVRQGVGDATAMIGRALGGHPIQSMETDPDEALRRCGDSEACAHILAENRNLAHGLDEVAKDVGEAGGRPAGEALFDYTTAKTVSTVLSLGGAAIVKAAEGGAPGGAAAVRVNRVGAQYPTVKDVITGDPIGFPEGSLLRVPKADRVAWGATERGEFIAEWYKRGNKTPSGGWEYYDIHHIKPREFGGSNAFENLTPVERTVEHQRLNRFWEKY